MAGRSHARQGAEVHQKRLRPHANGRQSILLDRTAPSRAAFFQLVLNISLARAARIHHTVWHTVPRHRLSSRPLQVIDADALLRQRRLARRAASR